MLVCSLYIVANNGTNKLDDIDVDIDIDISDSHFRDISGFGLAINVNSTSTVLVEAINTHFDMDPYDRGPRLTAANNNGLYGGWQQPSGCSYVPFCLPNNSGGSVLAYGNTIENASEDTRTDTTSTRSSAVFRNNYDDAQIIAPNADAAGNLGVGFPHPGFEVIPIDASPNDTAYDSLVSVKPSAAPSYPTSGLWSPGDYVRNTAPTASMPTQGWLRVTQSNTAGTNGAPNNDALGTDWIATDRVLATSELTAMRRYALRDDEWERISHLLHGRVGPVELGGLPRAPP